MWFNVHSPTLKNKKNEILASQNKPAKVFNDFDYFHSINIQCTHTHVVHIETQPTTDTYYACYNTCTRYH